MVRWLLFVTMFFFSLAVYSQGGKNPTGSDPKADARKIEKGAGSPAAIKVADSPDNLKKAAKDESTKSSNDPKNGWGTIWLDPVAIFTGVIAAFTIGLFAVGWNTSRRQLRAYTALYHVSFPFVEENPSPPGGYVSADLTVWVQNYGPTPAHQMTVWAHVTEQQPTSFTYPDRPLVEEQMLHPGQRFPTVVPLPTGFNSERAFWVYGRFVYQDIYRRWWVTCFCYQHHGRSRFDPRGPYNREEGGNKERPH